MMGISLAKEETVLCDDIFNRLNNVALIDRYNAYQLLHNEWVQISSDLEILQTEGFDACKKVDANMITKKKNNKEEIVQDGWIGRVLPFELVQIHLLSEQLDALKSKECRINDISAELETLLDELSDEDKECSFVNDEKDSFVSGEVNKTLKAKSADSETLRILAIVKDLLKEEKILKKEIKTASTNLHLLTKKTIEELTDEQAKELLCLKWIKPLQKSIEDLPNSILNEFVEKLQTLCTKYETTFAEVEEQIHETESTLVSLLDELTGNEFDMKGIEELKSLLGGK